MTEHVWICDAARRSGRPTDFAFFTDRGVKLPETIPREELLKTSRLSYSGVPLPAENFPKKLYNSVRDRFTGKLRPVSNNTFTLVTPEFVDILRQHDIGQCQFHPVDLYEIDGQTPIDAQAYILNVGNAKETVDFERTQTTVWFPNLGIRALLSSLKDDTVVVRADALEGPDIWADPKIGDGVFFLSERLKRAFEAAGLAKKMHLVRCETVAAE